MVVLKKTPKWIVGALALLPVASLGQTIPDAFTQGAGKTSVAISTTSEAADEFYLGKQKVDVSATGVNRITTDTYDVYVAHGLSDSIDVVAVVPYIRAYGHASDSTTELRGFQDGSAFLKWRFWQQESHVMGTGWFSLAGAVGLSGPLSKYDANALVDIGHRATTGDARLILQYISATGLFTVLQSGYTLRDGRHPDSIPISAKLGYFNRRFYVEGWMNQQIGRGGPDIGSGAPLSETTQNFLDVGIRGIAYVLPNIGVALGGGTTLSGRNVLKQKSWSAGLVYRPD